jgi:hypothetical protein
VPSGAANALKGKIVNRVFLGEVIDYVIDLGDCEWRARARSDDFQIGQPVILTLSPQKCVGLPG